MIIAKGYEPGTSLIARELEAQGYELRSEHLAHDLLWAEDAVRSALLDIQRRVTKLLDDLNGDMPFWAIHQIADSAGASGPIGSQWEKAIAKAVKVQTILDTCIVKVDNEN